MVAGAVPSAGVTPSVLIIDDDENVREYLQDVFHLEGFEVTSLSDPSVVVGRICDEPFQLIVVDLMMPKIDGLDLLARIRAVDEQIAVIMVTGYPSIETMSASMQLGISAYLAHPIRPAELRQAIARIVKHKRVVVRREDDLRVTIGQLIRRVRRARRLTLKELALRTKRPVSLLAQIERAEANASMSDLLTLAAELDLCLTNLFAGY